MTEREIIINWLVRTPDNEAHPNLVRVTMKKFNAEKYNDDVHFKVLAAGDEFDMALDTGQNTLREYYEKLDAESIVECFDGWCAHNYR